MAAEVKGGDRDLAREAWDHFVASEANVRLSAGPDRGVTTSKVNRWLDIFLRRAGDANYALTKDVSMRLCLFYMRELRSVCSPDNGCGDLERFVAGGRGHRILRFLERGYRVSGEEAVWWNGEFVDLVINLYQLSSSPTPQEKTSKLEPSCFKDCKFASIIDLWSCSKAVNIPSAKRKRRKVLRKSRQSSCEPFPSFPPPSASSTRTLSDLHQLECSISSSDGEADCGDDSRSGSRLTSADVKPYPPNPLDFAFFERPMHSEDEAKFLIDWHKRRRGTSTTATASSVPVVAEGEVDVDDEIRLLKEEEESQQGRNGASDETAALSGQETQMLFVSILIQVYLSQVKSKALKETYELSLKLLAFASDSLLALATTKNSRGTSTTADLSIPDRAKTMLKAQLCRLLLTALTGTQLHSDYVVALQGNKVLELTMLTLDDLVALAKEEPEDEKGQILQCSIELASCILHLVDSFYTYSWRWLPRSGVPKRLAENWSRNTSGFLTMEKLLMVYMKWCLKNRKTTASSSLFFKKLCTTIASFCEAKDAEMAVQPQTVSSLVSDQPHCRLYSTMAKYLPEAVRAGGLVVCVHAMLDALMASSSAWNCVSLTFLWDASIYAVRCSQGDMFDRKLVDELFHFAEAVLERDYILEKNDVPNAGTCFDLSSKRIHKRLFHHCQDTATISDSDSAFCASDASLDKITVARTEIGPSLGAVAKVPAKYTFRAFPQAKHYMEILRSDCPILVATVVAHLKKILLPSCQPFRYQIFSKVIVPFLQEQTLTPSAAADVDNVAVASQDCANRLEAIKKLLAMIPGLLGNKESLNHFQQHKVLNTVLAFKGIDGAVEVTYNVIRAYLIAEIDSVVCSKLFQKLTTVEIDVDSSSDGLEPALTDEEAFQPKFMKALTLTSIVKVFHQILVSKTAKVLDLKTESNGEAALSKLNDLEWEELVHIWKTQAVLVQRYPEYQDYAGSKGISRIVEDLFSYLSAKIAFSNLSHKMVGNFLLPILGFLLQVMIQFKENSDLSRREQDAADGYFNNEAILEESISALVAGTLKMQSASNLRKSVVTILSAAVVVDSRSTNDVYKQCEEYLDSDSVYDGDVSHLSDEASANIDTMVTIEKTSDIRSAKLIATILELCVKLLKSKHCHAEATAEFAVYKVRCLTSLRENALLLIKDGFLRKLIQSLVAFSDCKNGLVDEVFQLFVTLGKTELCRQDLRSVISIFKCDFLPEKFRKSLLEGLWEIASYSAGVNQPSHSLHFPPKKTNGLTQRKRPVSTTELSNASKADLESRPIKFVTNMPNTLTFSSKKGFTVCLWIRPHITDLKEDENQEIHIFGLSDSRTQLDILLSPSAITVSFQDCSSPLEFNRRQQQTATFKTSGYFRMPWNLVAISFLHKGKFFEVVTMINGCLLQSLLIPLQHKVSTSDDANMEIVLCRSLPVARQDSPSSSFPICFELASFHVYQDKLTTCHNGKEIMLLLLLGPKTGVFPSLTNEDIEVGKKDVLTFFPEHRSVFRDVKVADLCLYLEDNVLFFFTAQYPNRMVMYGRSNDCAKRSGGLSPHHTTKIPYPVEATRAFDFVVDTHFGFHDLLLQEGGTVTVLLLLARIVERGATDSDIAKVLDILFSTLNSSSRARRDFLLSDGVNLLARILVEEECDLDFQSVSSILNHSCSSPLIVSHGHRQNKTSFNMDANVVIHCPFNLRLLILCWDSLKKPTTQNVKKDLGCSTLTELVLEAFCLLLRNDHGYSKSNLEAFTGQHLAKAIIYKYLEDMTLAPDLVKAGKIVPLYDANIVSKKIVTLYGLLAGSPPDLKMVTEIRNNIMLLLDEEHTFVTVSKTEGFRFNVNENPSSKDKNMIKGPSREDQKKLGKQNDSLLHRSPAEILETEELHKSLKQIRDRRQSDGIPSTENRPNANLEERSISVVVEKEGPTEKGVEDIIELKSGVEVSDEPATDDAGHCEEKGQVSLSSTADIQEGTETHSYSRHGILEHPGKWGESKVGFEVADESVAAYEMDSRDDTICGLLDILYGLLQNLPDASVPHVVGEIILPEYLIVLCNQPSDKVRERAAWLLLQHVSRQLYLDPSVAPEAGKMNRVAGYGLVAEQLYKYPTTVAVVNACLSIVHNREVNLLEESPEIPAHAEVTVRASGLSLVLAVLPGACASGDVALAHMLVLHLHELLAKVPGLLHYMLSVGLQEAICKSLRSLATADYGTTDIEGQDSREIVKQDLHDFIRLICSRLVLLRGSDHYNALEIFLALLAMLSMNQQRPLDVIQPRNADLELSTYETFQTAFCVTIEESLSAIQSRVSDLDNPYHGKGRSEGKKRGETAYGAILPLEEVTGMIFRSMNPVGDADACSPGSMYSATTAAGSSRKLTAGVDFHGAKLAQRGDLTDRFASLVDFAINMLVFGPKASDSRNTLAISLLSLMITEVQLGWDNPKQKSIMANSQKLRRRLLVLTNACLSPSSSLDMRLKAVRIINNQFRTTDLLKHLFEGQSAMTFAFVLYLEDLLLNHKEEMPVDDIIGCKQFFDFMQTCGVSKFENLSDKESGIQTRKGYEESDTAKKDRLRFELNKLARQDAKEKSRFINCCQEKARKYYNNLEDQVKKMINSAKVVTEVAMQAQACERKAFMADMRCNLGEKVKAYQHWQDVVKRHTHDRSVWYFSDSAPRSWGLSETEGAQRIRIKMQRCHTKLPSKCYLPESKNRASCSIEEEKEGPFGFLSKGNGCLSGVIIEQLRADYAIRFMEEATLVLHDKELKGEVLVSKTAIYFVQQSEDENDSPLTSYEGGNHSPMTFGWNMDTVREIHRRWYQLSAVAVEVFFSTSSTTRFFAFSDSKRRDSFIRSLVDCQPRLSNLPHPDHIMELWQDGAITNFDYLMQLNKLAGRTFHDLMQYPVFPFILADYESDELDLYAASSFRDLKRPIAVQNVESEERYVNNYKLLSQDLQRGSEDSGPSTAIGPFHYGSHYSNAGVVLHFMVRVPPFTNMFLRFQGGNFDIPDRSFHSMANTWRLSSRDSTSDVKELIPDLFCLPEMLTNFEGFDFGEKQDGEQVGDVVLPPWANGSPRIFMKVHRQALESDYVREHLCHWIDLIFGYKQTGKEAVAAVNVFHPSTYYGFDINTIEDPVLRAARATMIKTYGQTPKQLFHLPHPMVTRNPADIPAVADPPDVPKVLEQVHGLQWGGYVGSPSQAPPAIVLKVGQPRGVATFVALANNEVYGLPSNTTLVSRYVQEAPATSLGVQWQFSVAGAALLCYGQPDGVVRARLRKTMPPEPFFSPSEEITLLRTYPGCSQVWIAYESGKIDIIGLNFRPKDLSLVPTDEKYSLFAHTDRLNGLELCPEFSVAISGSEDSTAIIWDLKAVSYVRTLHHEGPVKIVAASKTSGDLATISSVQTSIDTPATKTRLSLFSVNGALAAAAICQPAVSSLCFSSSPEGVSCNVVATGHVNGVVRLWNSWNLTHVRDIDTTQTLPIISLCWSPDCQNLYTSTEAGELIVFEKADVTGMGNAPRYVNLTPMA